MKKKQEKQSKNNDIIYKKLLATAHYLFPGFPLEKLSSAVIGIMKGNPNATEQDFAKMAQGLAKAVKSGEFYKQVAVAKIQNNIQKGIR